MNPISPSTQVAGELAQQVAVQDPHAAASAGGRRRGGAGGGAGAGGATAARMSQARAVRSSPSSAEHDVREPHREPRRQDEPVREFLADRSGRRSRRGRSRSRRTPPPARRADAHADGRADQHEHDARRRQRELLVDLDRQARRCACSSDSRSMRHRSASGCSSGWRSSTGSSGSPRWHERRPRAARRGGSSGARSGASAHERRPAHAGGAEALAARLERAVVLGAHLVALVEQRRARSSRGRRASSRTERSSMPPAPWM